MGRGERRHCLPLFESLGGLREEEEEEPEEKQESEEPKKYEDDPEDPLDEKMKRLGKKKN